MRGGLGVRLTGRARREVSRPSRSGHRLDIAALIAAAGSCRAGPVRGGRRRGGALLCGARLPGMVLWVVRLARMQLQGLLRRSARGSCRQLHGGGPFAVDGWYSLTARVLRLSTWLIVVEVGMGAIVYSPAGGYGSPRGWAAPRARAEALRRRRRQRTESGLPRLKRAASASGSVLGSGCAASVSGNDHAEEHLAREGLGGVLARREYPRSA